MSTFQLVRTLAAALLFVLASVAAGEQAAKRRAVPAVPFDCNTSAWDGSFAVLSTRYDRPGNRVIWMLEARKAGPLAAYEAFVADPDGVEVDTIKVKFAPAVAKVKVGAKLQAELPLGTTAGEPAKITIRARR